MVSWKLKGKNILEDRNSWKRREIVESSNCICSRVAWIWSSFIGISEKMYSVIRSSIASRLI